MSVTKYTQNWFTDEDPFDELRKRTKRAERRDWKKQVQEELDEMEDENE